MSAQGELKTVFGLDGTTLVHVSEVTTDNRRRIRCLRCDAALVAKMGPKRRHHFGHRTECACDGGRETAIHLFCKAALQRRLELTVPESRGSVPALGLRADEFVREGVMLRRPTDGTDRFEATFRPQQVMRFDSVSLEVAFDGFRPDAVASKGARQIAVEFANTHFADAGKVALIRSVSLSTVEVDVSDPPMELSPLALERWVLHEAPRAWLHNGRAADWVGRLRGEVEVAVEAKRRLEAAREVARAQARERAEASLERARVRAEEEATARLRAAAEDEAQEERRRAAAVLDARDAILANLAPTIDEDANVVPDEVLHRVDAAGLAWAADWAPGVRTCLRVDDAVWQTHVLAHLVTNRAEVGHPSRAVTEDDLGQLLVDLGFAHGSLVHVHDENVRFVQERSPGLQLPTSVLLGYLEHLERRGVITRVVARRGTICSLR